MFDCPFDTNMYPHASAMFIDYANKLEELLAIPKEFWHYKDYLDYVDYCAAIVEILNIEEYPDMQKYSDAYDTAKSTLDDFLATESGQASLQEYRDVCTYNYNLRIKQADKEVKKNRRLLRWDKFKRTILKPFKSKKYQF